MTEQKSFSSSLAADSKMVLFLIHCLRRFVFIMALMLMPLSVVAQETAEADVNLGVIDMNDIIRRSDAVATIRATFDEENKAFQSEISADELRLRQKERDLDSLRETVSEDEFQKRRAEFENDVLSIQRSIQLQKNSFDRSIQQVRAKIEKELLKIVSEIAQERQLAVVFQRQNIVLYNNALDITAEALSRLNERTKNIKVTKQPENP
jgi:outer membrane protein